MCIFPLPVSLPAPLNAFRGNVLDISSRFQFLLFSTLIRPRRTVPTPAPRSPSRLALPCLALPLPVSRLALSSRIISSRPARLPVPSLPVFLAVLSLRSRYHRPVCRVVWQGVGRSGSSRSDASAVALPVSVAFPRRAKLAPSIVSSCGEGSGKEQPCPCRLRVCAISV